MLWHSNLDFALNVLDAKADLKKPWTTAYTSWATCRWDAVTVCSPFARSRTLLLCMKALEGIHRSTSRFLKIPDVLFWGF